MVSAVIGAAAVDGELAVVQRHDPVGEPHRQVEIVQHRDHGGAACARRRAVSTRSIW